MAYYLKSQNDSTIKRKVKYRAGRSSSGEFATSPRGTRAEWLILKKKNTRKKTFQMHVFKPSSLHICQLFAQLRSIARICCPSCRRCRVGRSQPPTLQLSQGSQLCHQSNRVATGTRMAWQAPGCVTYRAGGEHHFCSTPVETH